MPKILANRINIYYETHGDGLPLILISGLGGDHMSVWPNVINTFASNYKTLVFDNRGIGKTDIPDTPYSIEIMADDLAALMNSLEINRAHIIGYSMGGQIALKFAEKYPDKINKLVICVCYAKINTHARLFLDTLLKLWQNGASNQTISELVMPWIFSDDYLEQHYHSMMAEEDPSPQPFHGFKRQYEAQRNFEPEDTLFEKIKVQTLFVGGGKDLLCTSEDVKQFSDKISNSELFMFPDAGHLVSLEQPDEFAQVILDFLKKN